MADNRPIGFFDSGLGGLTCIPHLQKALPCESVIYYGDTARTPYGSKSPETIKKYSFQIADYLMNSNVKMIVIACNTISAVALDDLRERHPEIPIIGIIDPMVYSLTHTEFEPVNIGLLGTRVTIESGTYEKLIARKSSNIHLYGKACPLFVPVIEEGFKDDAAINSIIRFYLDDFIKENNLKKLILGCTHYPFLIKNLKSLYPDIEFLNPSEVVVEYIEKVLRERDEFADSPSPIHTCFASDLSTGFINVVDRIFPDGQDININFKRFEG